MKKMIKILSFVLCLSMIFTACAKKDAMGENMAKQLAESHVQMIIDGNYEGVVNDFQDAVKKQLDAAALESAWGQVASMAGEYMLPYSAQYTSKDGLATVVTVLEYENMGISISLTYDTEGKIRGLWFNTAPIKYEITDNEILTEQEIAVGPHNLKGVVTLPDGVDNYPVVVLVQGSGASDFDETIGANKPFKELAHGLAEKGIASVRVNKRFFQNPDLAHDRLTIYDEYMDDVYAAINYAKANISENVYVIGHSQGGMSAPKIALDNNLSGVVMMAGTIRGLEDIVYDQNAAALETMDQYTEKEKGKILQATKDGVDAIKSMASDATDPVLGIPAEYWLSLRDLDAENILKNKLTVPVLVLQGTADFQVYMDKDFEYMQSVLGNKENITFKSYDGLNHLFMPQSLPGVADTSEYAAENHIPQYVIDDIAAFIIG